MKEVHKVEITQGEKGIDFFVNGVKPEFMIELLSDRA
jgi:hypothetical protein